MDDSNLAKLKKDWIENSNHRFKKISLPEGKGKFDMLPRWLDNVSYRYNQEAENNFPQKYYHYSRGTIIRVDFGINMGSEFCGPHFAIVLDKKDNARKRTLTVVPLTSKPKKGRFPLGKEIFNQTTEILKSQFNNTFQTVKSFSKNIDEDSTILDKLKANPTPKDNDIEYMEKRVAERKEQVKDINKELEKLRKVISIYSNYNKNSFARLTDITTISKFRIKRINKFDPSGKIRLSEQQMQSISKELMNLFITR